jgi:hypothetical protein
MRTIFGDLLVLAANGELSWSRQAKIMTPLYLSRELCPKCGKPMTAVADDVASGRPHYVCVDLRGRSAARSRRPEVGGKPAAIAGQITFELKSSPAAGLLQRPMVLTTLSDDVAW